MASIKSIDSDFFKEPNILNSYWAGFIAADGCITKNPTCDSNKLTIGLSIKDLKHLQKFKRQLKSEHKICEYSYSRKLQKQKEYKIYHSCFIYISDKNIIHDLKTTFCISPLKSNRETFPKLSVENTKAFIIGYIDGDGSIGIPYRNPNCRVLKILGSKKLLNNIKAFLNKQYGIHISANVRKDKGIHAITIEGTYIKPLLNDLKRIKVPKLKRKWNRV